MKHSWDTTALLILLFVTAQVVGLLIVSQYIDIAQTAQSGSTVINEENYVIAQPEITDNTWSFIPIILAILIGTGLVLLIVKFGKTNLWKTWYLLSMIIALFFAAYPFITKLVAHPTSAVITIIISVTLGWLKTYKKSPVIHNFTEVLVYGGIAALLVPMLNIYAGIILLLLISVYDAYAVWKSKHMVSLATFQADAEVFAGLYIPKGKLSGKIVSSSARTTKSQGPSYALLGGGDIAFPLIFVASVFKMTNSIGFAALIIIGSTLGLTALFILSKANRFYPAMPMISLGTLLAFIAGLLIF